MTTTTIIDAINELFGDTTVSPKTTLEALEEIQEDIQSKIDALQADIKRGESGE